MLLNKKRKKIVYVLSTILVVIYILSYAFRWQLGIVKPMANLRYFYYISEPNNGLGWYNSEIERASWDNFFYYFYYPVYKPYYLLQKLFTGERHEVHWSNRS